MKRKIISSRQELCAPASAPTHLNTPIILALLITVNQFVFACKELLSYLQELHYHKKLSLQTNLSIKQG